MRAVSDERTTRPGGAPLRWFTEFGPDHSFDYVERFRALAADGTDIDGEARFVDALLPRGARVLDGGCGPGRVGAALAARRRGSRRRRAGRPSRAGLGGR